MEIQSIQPTKSPSDDREYQAMVLSNDLKVLMIHDPMLKKSACSLSVGVGSLEDYDQSLGLAHFLQHMLFMGSKKFPLHNEYSSFISLHSGFDNAYTSDEQTNYYLQIATEAFREGVERLTNFFTGALLLEECIKKEIQSVHEEYVLWTNDDNCIKWEILRQLAEGPYSKFSIGNNQTLSHKQIRTDLSNFYNQHYSSNRMNAVICSNLPISTIKSQLVPYFSQIINKQKKPFQYDLPFKSKQLGKMIIMQSIKDECLLQFFWVVEHLRKNYKNHIEQYITHILGHQAQYSLLSILKKQQYASKLGCYKHHLMSQTIIGLQIKLTDEGLDHINQVYNIVIDYIGSLKADASIYQQLRQKAEINFKFKSKKQPSKQVNSLSSKMHHIILAQILNSEYIYNQFDEQMLNRILGQLNPFNLIMVLSNHNEIDNCQIQKYLGGKYRIQKLPERKKTNIDFKNLQKNKFLPINIQLYEQNNEKYPIQLKQNIIYMNRTKFNQCKGGVQITINGEQQNIFRQFYAKYLQLLLKQTIYNAEVLNLSLNFSTDDNLTMQIFGFNNVVQKLLQIISESFYELHSSQDSEILFQLSLEDLIQQYENYYCEEVDDIANNEMDRILRSTGVKVTTILKQLQSYKYETITKRIMQFWKNCNISYVFVGNFKKQYILQTVAKFENKIGGKNGISNKIEQIKCLKLTKPIKYVISLSSEQISTSGCIVYFQAGPYSIDLYYLMVVLKNYIQEPFFDELRTKRQMAYSLATRLVNNRGILGMYFELISSTCDPQTISIAINDVVRKLFTSMEQNLTEQKFNTLKESVKTKFITPHNNLSQLFDFVCKQINERTFYFTKKELNQVSKHLNSITKEQLLLTVNKLLKNSLQIYVVSKQHQELFKKHIISNNYNFEEIKKQFLYHQDYIMSKPIKLE